MAAARARFRPHARGLVGRSAEIAFDPARSQRNRAEQGLSFERVIEADRSAALIVVDDREDHGERRLIAQTAAPPSK